MTTAGRQLLSSLVKAGDVQTYIKMGLDESLFKDGEVILFNAIENHLHKFGAIPKKKTIVETAGLEDSLVLADEPPKFYLEEVHKRFMHQSLKAGVQKISSFLMEKNVDEAFSAIVKIAQDLHQRKYKKHITDFRDASEIVYNEYIAQKQAGTTHASLPFGWPSLDEQTGGARAGDFISIVGRPMQGKSQLMIYTADQAWRSGRTPLLVSMEMHTNLIHQRLAALRTSTKLTPLLKAELSTSAFKSMISALNDLKQHKNPFWVVDGNQVKDANDLYLQCQILQPDCLWVDAAYLLKHSGTRLNKWEKQSENAEFMKQRIATDMGIPVTASYQFSKAASKESKKGGKDKKDGAPMTLDDIHGSDAIAQLSSLSLGLFQFENDIEALKKRVVHILKGRSGEVGFFEIYWDWVKMNFSEIVKEDPKTVQLQHLG